MSLVAHLKEHASQADQTDIREYVELLRLDSPDAFDRISKLMVRLQKSIENVEADRDAIRRTTQLRSVIRAARGVGKPIRDMAAQISAFDKETARLVADRAKQRSVLAEEFGRHHTVRNDGENAIAEMEELKKRFEDVLKDEPVDSVESLK